MYSDVVMELNSSFLFRYVNIVMYELDTSYIQRAYDNNYVHVQFSWINELPSINRYVCVGSSLPELALTSLQILYWVTQSHKAGRDVITTIVGDKVRFRDFVPNV